MTTSDELDRILIEGWLCPEKMIGQVCEGCRVRIDQAKAALHRLVLKERRKQTRKILRHEIDVWGSSRNESYLKSEIADLDAEIKGSNHG